MVLTTQGSHFVAAADHTAAEAVEVEGIVKVITKAEHEAIARRAKALKAGHERSLSTPFTVLCEGLASSTCGANLASALQGSEAVLELEVGTYTHSSTFTINRDVTVQAKSSGTVILDGEETRQVMRIEGGIVGIKGIDITKGYAMVSACFLNLPGTFFRGPRRKKLPGTNP